MIPWIHFVQVPHHFPPRNHYLDEPLSISSSLAPWRCHLWSGQGWRIASCLPCVLVFFLGPYFWNFDHADKWRQSHYDGQVRPHACTNKKPSNNHDRDHLWKCVVVYTDKWLTQPGQISTALTGSAVVARHGPVQQTTPWQCCCPSKPNLEDKVGSW